MKKEKWKFLSLFLSILSVLLLLYGFFQPALALKPENMTTAESFTGIIDLTPNMILPTANDPVNVDQVQDQVSGRYYIGYQRGGCGGCYKQLIYNTRQPFIGFAVGIGKQGTPTEPLYIGVLKQGGEGYENPLDSSNYHVIGEVSPSIDIPPNVLVWLEGEFSNNPYDKREVNLVLLSTDNPADGNYWLWGYTTGNPYQDGNPDFIWDQPGAWCWDNEQWSIGGQSDEDFAFVTYTEGGTYDDPPEINITVSSWVVTNTGIVFLLFAAISWMRYGSLVG